jgi:RNA polymerase sigma factor (sigma-70 family)
MYFAPPCLYRGAGSEPMTERPSIRALNAELSEANLPPDALLIERYSVANDHAAFELLVRRHAEMVWRVCRGVLSRDRHAAEDALQATFLVLARKAESVGSNLPGWLFRVARRIAIRAGKRPNRTTVYVELDRIEIATEADPSSDIAPILFEEIERLAAKFRDPVLLCYYEGHTHAEAAAKLGWPIGTLASRLARAKETLRDRLSRRGVALSAAGLAGALSSPVSALGPDVLRSSIATILGPPTAVSATVVSLSNGVLMAMRIARLKWVGLASAMFLGIAGAGIAVGIGQDKPPAKAEAPKIGAATVELARTAFPEIKSTDADRLPADRPVAGANDSDLRRLQVARFQLALTEYEVAMANSRAFASPETRTLVSAAIDVFPPNEAAKWLAWNVAVAKRVEASIEKLAANGDIGLRQSAQAATRGRVEAEIELLKYKQVRVAVRDPKVVDLAKRQIQQLELSLSMNVKLLEGGAYDVNTLFTIFVLHRDLLSATIVAFGESREALDRVEAVQVQATAVHAYLKKRWEAGTVRREELTVSEAHLLFVAGEIESLKSRLGPVR